jgi:alpha,alpha-trehalose phosphorylase (configuration-retaining)
VSHPDQRISAEEKQSIIDWITDNASRYWLSEGGPLRPPEEGGADVVIVRISSLLALKTTVYTDNFD